MGWSTSVVIPPDGNMGDYMDSLEKLQKRNKDLLLSSWRTNQEATAIS